MSKRLVLALSAIVVLPVPSFAGQQVVPPLDNGMPTVSGRQQASNTSQPPQGEVSFPPPVSIGVAVEPLNRKQRAALGISRKRIATKVLPRAAEDGAVQYDYNHGEPFVVCAPGRFCGIRLEAGEIINGGEGAIALTDKINWTAIPKASGSRSSLITVVWISPKFAETEAGLAFSTNKGRHYNIRLRSTKTEYMPMTAFAYPDDELKRAQEDYQRQVQQANTGPAFDISALSCGYSITGDAAFAPIAVCSDGQRTVIDFGKRMNEVPAIVGIMEKGGWFSDDKREVLNATYYETPEGTTKMLVDSVVSTAALVSGAGNGQKEVLIERRN